MIKTLTHQQGRFGGPGCPVIQKLLSVFISVSSYPGVIEHRSRPNSPIRYFTQEEINQGQIMYRPPAAPPHLQEFMAFSFAGNASVSALRHRVSPSMSGSPPLPQNLRTESLATLFSLFKITWSLSTCTGLGSDLSFFF